MEKDVRDRPALHEVESLEVEELVGTGGNLTTDVQLAAYAFEYDADMFSNDTDFARFPGLRWHNPLS